MGWTVVLLCRKAPAGESASCYDRVEYYTDVWDALEKASRFAPVAYHVFTTWLYQTGAAFVRYRPGKVIIDTMDVLAGMVRPELLLKHYSEQTRLERYCLEFADGLCCRSLETQYVKRRFGYRFRGPRLFFADYSVLGDVSAGSDERREGIHVVHIGTMMLEKREPLHKAGHFLEVARRLAADGIHFHLYGGAKVPGAFEDLYADYLELERKTGFVHVHREVPLPQLLRELKGYTFGLHTAGSLLHFRNSHPDSLPPRHEYYTASRVYDFIIAGLPVILHEGRFLFWLTRRWGRAVLVDEGFLREPARWLRERLPDEQERARLRESWRAIDCAREAPRLARFYESLADAPGKMRVDGNSPSK